MPFIDYFRQKKKPAAAVAKERLQIIVAHERGQRGGNKPNYLPQLERDILEVIRKYVEVDEDAIKVHLEHNKEDDLSVLELNITLPDDA